MSKPTTTLERRLALSARGCRVTTAVRQHGASAYGLGGLHGLALWLQARARLARLSPVEMQALRALARVLVQQSASIRRSLEQQLQAAAEQQQQQVPASFNWEQRQQLLVQREAQRRAGGSQQVTLVPAVAAPVPMGRHSRQAKGECGQRLSKKLDLLLAELREPMAAAGAEVLAAVAAEPIPVDLATVELAAAAEPETLGHQIGDHREPGPEATNPAVAGVLADALVSTASPAPEAPSAAAALQPLAESATADLQAQVRVAAAQADLEPEPAEPLPVSIHSAAAVPETQAIAAALEEAWLVEHPAPATAAAIAELSPKARAIAELAAALLRGDQTITLPAALAAELLEALVAT